MANLVVYCGIVVEVRVALGATLVCTTIYTTAENPGYTNDTHTTRTIKTQLFQKLYFFLHMLAQNTFPEFTSCVALELGNIAERLETLWTCCLEVWPGAYQASRLVCCM